MTDAPQSFQRAIDKYATLDLCKLTPDERNEFYAAIAARGAYSALQHIGLDDERAVSDLKFGLQSIRNYRSASNIVRNAAWVQMKTLIKVIGYVLSIATTLALLKLFLPAAEADRIISYIPH